MKFDQDLLQTYKTLLQTTDLAESYQEFVRLSRYLRVELEKQLTDCKFQGNIVENGMDYSYFQFTNASLKRKGLKLAVTFVHRDFRFEVWLSGINRNRQSIYYELLKAAQLPFALTGDPLKTDHILKIPLDPDMDLADGECVLAEVKAAALEILAFTETIEAA